MPHAHNGFLAFGHGHGHGHARSSSLASSSSSWRTRAAAPSSLSPTPATTPRNSQSKRSQKAPVLTSRHRQSGSQSSSSDESTTSWRSLDTSAFNRTATSSAFDPAVIASGVCCLLNCHLITSHINTRHRYTHTDHYCIVIIGSAPASKQGIYSMSELMSLESSPLVGLTPESQAIVDEFVAHHVYRRPQGPSSGGRGTGHGSRGARRATTERVGSGSGSNSPRSSTDAESDGDASRSDL